MKKLTAIAFLIMVLFAYGCEKFVYPEEEPDPTCLNCHPTNRSLYDSTYGTPYEHPYGKYK